MTPCGRSGQLLRYKARRNKGIGVDWTLGGGGQPATVQLIAAVDSGSRRGEECLPGGVSSEAQK